MHRMLWNYDEQLRLVTTHCGPTFLARLIAFVHSTVVERFSDCSEADVQGLVVAAASEAVRAGIRQHRLIAQYVALRFWLTDARVAVLRASVASNERDADAAIESWLDAAARIAA